MTTHTHDPHDPARQPLDTSVIEQKLANLPGWEIDMKEHALTRVFRFETFMQSIAFVNNIARLAEEQNHHPTIQIAFKIVTLTLTTFSAKAVTEQDFMLATKINQLSLKS
jgi:4a-hydroxytetrahydrobiopterin dehydratase